MAYQQQQDRGPLQPGQTISVNKYQVQIERYLSKGGYAYVYLVRTPQPVGGTSQHVLKRIAVPNEGMLAEVKKEVDIMRILRGHPNIVNLIDAAWHRLPNGVYEIFILMEFCAGGGIIDMMNRRLRERLTEAEILQIFVDTCEGVAAMHALRPALLHRDLKVENILQASATSFKLCDFGSATPAAARAPSTAAEIRALEADLNRHTTLQYRAPEMVDPYLRRAVDEKADVWALGVLLYKLCYYTTPFEEHGPLAILNVQYKIPAYPVYSAHMNALIGSMLREHGAQRPTVFELLAVVHRMRGTKSRFTYARPAAPAAPFPTQQIPAQALSPPAQPKNAGVQARETVLAAIAPMRRGRPETEAGAGAAEDFQAAEDASWARAQAQKAAVRPHRSGLPPSNAGAPWNAGGARDDAWAARSPTLGAGATDKADRRKTFQADAFKGFGDAFDDVLSSGAGASSSLSPPPAGSGTASLAVPGASAGANGQARDAFYGLGISPSEKPAQPTLAEARRMRTGLASGAGAGMLGSSPSGAGAFPPRTSSRASPNPPAQQRPTPSPQPIAGFKPGRRSPQPPSQPSANYTPGRRSPQPPAQSVAGFTPGRRSPQPPSQPGWKPPPSPRRNTDDLTAEERFPSLEDLDRALSPPESTAPGPAPHAASQPDLSTRQGQGYGSPQLPPRPPQYASPAPAPGARSEHVTGAAMRGAPDASAGVSGLSATRPQATSRPSLVRRHRSSVNIQHTTPSPAANSVPLPAALSPPADVSPDMLARPPSAAEILGRPAPGARDWLTGSGSDEEGARAAGTPVLRGSPSKRASVALAPARALAQRATHDRTPTAEAAPFEFAAPASVSPEKVDELPASKYNWRQKLADAPGAAGARTTPTGTAMAPKPVAAFGTGVQALGTGAGAGAGRPFVRPKPAHALKPLIPAAPVAAPSGASEALSDNWSPVAATHPAPPAKARARSKSRTRARDASSGESEEGPEDAGISARARRARAHGRQSSVHELVDLWGGNAPDKPAPAPAPARAPSPAKGPGSAHTRLQKFPAQNGNGARPRPQSMLLSPAPAPGAPKQPSPTERAPPATLGAPPDPRARAVRRTSISDMVLKYEALRSPGAGAAGPVSPALAPAKLTGGGALPSPRAGAFAVPAVPLQARSRSMGTPLGGVAPQQAERPRGTTGAVGLPGLAAPGARPPRAASPSRPTEDAGELRPGYALPPRTVAASPAPMSESAPTPAGNGAARSPSPDKPYQGVGRLIDQWQRKTGAESGPGAKPGGALGARKAGVVAGRGR